MKSAVVTGGGSGVGRALALRLAETGWQVAILGRRVDALNETAQLAGGHMSQIRVHPCDVGDPQSVITTATRILEEFGAVDVLVNSAGANVPRRALSALSLDDYHAMIAVNLNGAFYCAQAFLPQMRTRKNGTIINIVSEAGRRASEKAGAGYVMSKFGMAGLTESINAEERRNGIRASAIFPGDIDTPLLDKRPQPPDAADRATMLRPEDVADCALFCINLPPRVVVEEMLVRPR
ncbi:MAG TPA: SDR family oxidoreductase [Terriglobia bacterium]|nr:SDR family oxidoreductase [Terriglobia bacterium]